MPNANDRRKSYESDELNPSFDFSRSNTTENHYHEARVQLSDVNSAFKLILEACRAEDGIDKKAVEALTSGYTDMIKAASESQISIHTSIHANKRESAKQEHENELALLKQKHAQNMTLISTLGSVASGVISTVSEINSLRKENNELINKIEKFEKQSQQQRKDNSPTAPTEAKAKDKKKA